MLSKYWVSPLAIYTYYFAMNISFASFYYLICYSCNNIFFTKQVFFNGDDWLGCCLIWHMVYIWGCCLKKVFSFIYGIRNFNYTVFFTFIFVNSFYRWIFNAESVIFCTVTRLFPDFLCRK